MKVVWRNGLVDFPVERRLMDLDWNSTTPKHGDGVDAVPTFVLRVRGCAIVFLGKPLLITHYKRQADQYNLLPQNNSNPDPLAVSRTVKYNKLTTAMPKNQPKSVDGNEMPTMGSESISPFS